MKVEFTNRAKKDFKKLPIFIQNKFFESFEKLKKSETLDIKKMVGRGEQYRIRVGNFRAIIEKEEKRWLILFFGSRGTIYCL